MIWKTLALLAFGSVAVSPATAQRAQLATSWWIEPASPPAGVRHLVSKEPVLKQRLLPSGLVRLSRSVAAAEAGFDLAAGTELIEVTGGPGPIFCDGRLEAIKFVGTSPQGCLLDQNADGLFDASFRVASQTPALVTINGRMPKKLRPLANPIPFERVDPATSNLGAFVAIERRNYFNIYGRENFMIAFGSGDHLERITDPIGFKSSELPKQMSILGSSFTALKEENGQLAVRVDAAMPHQPFGVVKTVSFR